MSDVEHIESTRPMMTLVIPLVVFGLAAIGVATIVDRRTDDGVVAASQAAVVAIDTFDRDDSAGLSGIEGLPSSHEWRVVAGDWEIELGKAFVSTSTSDDAIAVIDDPADGASIAIKASIGGSTACGVIARFVDQDNFVSLSHLPAYGVWVLTVVENGERRVVHKLSAQRLGDVVIQLTVGPTLITASAGSQSTSIAEPSTPEQRNGGVGLYAAAIPSDCTWDDVAVTSSG